MWGGRTGEGQSLSLKESEENLVMDMLELQVSFVMVPQREREMVKLNKCST